MTTTSQAIVVSAAAAYIAVLAVHSGLAAAPVIIGPLLLAAIILPLTKRYRDRAAESGLLAEAVALLAISAGCVAYGYVPRLPRFIPWQAVVWIPVIVSVFLLEFTAALAGVRGTLAATAAAGAAFMIYPGQGVDTITIYQNQTASLAIGAFIVIAAAFRSRLGPMSRLPSRLFFPFVVVAIGCLVHWFEGGPRYSRDILVFIPLISVPAALGAVVTAITETIVSGSAAHGLPRPN